MNMAAAAAASGASSAAAARRRHVLSALSLSIPFAVLLRDCFLSTHRVRGPSMEPALRDGDVVLVRRADTPLLGWVAGRSRRGGKEGERRYEDTLEEEGKWRDDRDRKMMRRMERETEELIEGGGGGGDDTGGLLGGGVIFRRLELLPGDVAVFKSPFHFPVRYSAKRVAALGGQRVRPAGEDRTVEIVPAEGMWMEGDNAGESDDSRRYGAVNRKIVVGKVERIIWPPSRWGPVERKRPNYGRAWWP